MKLRLFLLSVGLSLVAHAQLLNNPDLVGYYTFSDPNDLGLDSSMYGNNLIMSGSGVAYVSSGVGGSGGLSLSGSGALTSEGNVPPGNFPIGDSSYTLSAWFFTGDSNVGGGVGGGIIGWGGYSTYNSNGGDTNALRLDNNSGTLGFDNYWWNQDLLGYPSNQSNFLGAWNNVTVTYNGTVRTLYYNGVALVSDDPVTAPQTGTNSGDPNVQAENFFLGETFPTNPSDNEFFTGTLSDVAIFDTGLTQGQVESLLSEEENGVPEPGTMWMAMGVGLLLLAPRRGSRASVSFAPYGGKNVLMRLAAFFEE